MKEKKFSSLFDEYTEEFLMSLEEFTNTSYDELISGDTIIPSEKESRRNERNERDRNIINWLLGEHQPKDERQFKKLGKRFFEEKKYVNGFKNRYKKDPENFKKNRYSAYIIWMKKQNGLL